MIKKKFKLKGEEIKNFFQNKNFKKIAKNNFLVFYKENSLNFSRFAVICKKNIFKKATLRNRIKRRIYEIIRNDILPIKFKKNYDFLILPQKEESFINFKESLLKIFKRFNV